MLTVNHLEVKYGSQTALSIHDPITFEKKDRIGIIGSNGAGKTTLVNAILGIVNYTGSIQTDLKPEQIAVHLQFNHYTNNMHVRHIMETIANASIKKNKELQELISFFQFEKCLNKKFKSLSGGEKQRMTIILILMQQADLVFFDEVTSGLDFETRQKLMDLLAQWYEDHPATVCMVSHYYEELEKMANRILIIDKGQVVDFGDTCALFEKYCGKVILSMEKNPKNIKIVSNFITLEAPEHELVVSCANKQEEFDLVTLLVKENIDFKRSTKDLEILYINAKSAYHNSSKKDSGNGNLKKGRISDEK